MSYSIADIYFDKGALIGVATGVFPWLGIFNGYTSSRFYKFFNGSKWTKMDFCSMFFLPGFISACLMLIDVCEWIETGRADTIPVREALLLALYWFVIHVPLCFVGSYIGFSAPRINTPVKTNRMQREVDTDIDRAPYWCEIPGFGLIAAFLPTCVLMLQLWQIMEVVNGAANMYALHGMLYVVFICFIIVVIEVSIIYTYVTLSMEEPNWWWRVWWGGSLIGFYGFLIMLFYLLIDLKVEYVTTLISYCTACILTSSMLGLMAASITMLCAFTFNLMIYRRVKLE